MRSSPTLYMTVLLLSTVSFGCYLPGPEPAIPLSVPPATELGTHDHCSSAHDSCKPQQNCVPRLEENWSVSYACEHNDPEVWLNNMNNPEKIELEE